MVKYFIILALLLASFASHSYLAEKTLGRVGEKVISLSSLKLYRKQIKEDLFYKSPLFEIFSEKELLLSNKKLLTFMLFDLMILEIAEKTKFEATTNQINQALNDIRKNRKHKLFAKKLALVGYSLKTFRKKLMEELKKSFLVSQAVFSKIKISEEMVVSYYFNKYKKNLYTFFEYDFSFISFARTEDGIQKARKVLELIKRASFEQASSSLPSETKVLTDRQMGSRMKKALKNLSVSEVSPIVPIAKNLYIFKLNWKTPKLTSHQQKQKQEIESFLFKQEIKKELKKWLGKQKEEFFVKANLS